MAVEPAGHGLEQIGLAVLADVGAQLVVLLNVMQIAINGRVGDGPAPFLIGCLEDNLDFAGIEGLTVVEIPAPAD